MKTTELAVEARAGDHVKKTALIATVGSTS
jgi:hypothetical protein